MTEQKKDARTGERRVKAGTGPGGEERRQGERREQPPPAKPAK